jgi:hypothetical protein
MLLLISYPLVASRAAVGRLMSEGHTNSISDLMKLCQKGNFTMLYCHSGDNG